MGSTVQLGFNIGEPPQQMENLAEWREREYSGESTRTWLIDPGKWQAHRRLARLRSQGLMMALDSAGKEGTSKRITR